MAVTASSSSEMLLQLADYIVISVMLTIPLCIGAFFAYKDRNKVTMDDYLWGGRDMSLLPVALSIFVTFKSAIALIGFPTEVYMYGSMILALFMGVMITCVIAVFTFVPLMYPLRLASMYEYLQFRFESQAVRLFCTVLGMIQNFSYLIVALLAPGLALEASAGLPFWLSVIIVGTVATIFTAIGGIKSVIWTDAIQAFIILIGIATVIIKGSIAVGGLDEVWSIAEDGGRTSMNNISPDIRTRHTWWNLILGGTFVWATCLFNQSSFQRMGSMNTQRKASMTFLLNVPMNAVLGLALILFGWVMYAYLYQLRCDPIQAGIVSNKNQLTPYFVLHVVYDLPGFAGLYMSSLFSGAMSTISSGINGLAANTMQDLLKPLPFFRRSSETTVTNVTKLIACFYGFSITVLAYVAKSFQGPITQLSMSVVGTFGSVLVGVFLLGSIVPWSTKHGAFVGALVAVTINSWLAIGSTMYGRKTKPLDPVPSDQCFNATSSNMMNDTQTTPYRDILPDQFSIYDISYAWYSVIGAFLSFGIGLIVSLVSRCVDKKRTTQPKLIIPIFRKFWNFEEYESTSRAAGEREMINSTTNKDCSMTDKNCEE